MNGGNHLDHIIDEVKKHGTYEEPWDTLTNAYFRGDDCFEEIKTWAKSVGLSVTFSNRYQTCTFQEAGEQPT